MTNALLCMLLAAIFLWTGVAFSLFRELRRGRQVERRASDYWKAAATEAQDAHDAMLEMNKSLTLENALLTKELSDLRAAYDKIYKNWVGLDAEVLDLRAALKKSTHARIDAAARSPF